MIVNGEGKINGNAIYTLVSEEECREMSADLEHSYCPKQKIGYNAFETTLRYKTISIDIELITNL